MKKKINMYQKIKNLDKVKKIVRDQMVRRNSKTLLKNNVNQSELTFLFNDDYRELLNFHKEQANLIEKQIKSINIINYPTNKRIKNSHG